VALQTVYILYTSAMGRAVLDTVRAVLAEQLPACPCVEQPVEGATPAEWEGLLQSLIRPDEGTLLLTLSDCSPTDPVPDATTALCTRFLPGFGTLIRTGLPEALLWRNTAGLCGQTLLLNLPASAEAIEQRLPRLFPAIPNAVMLAGR
jgi:molybdopterin adenylyltransferase